MVRDKAPHVVGNGYVYVRINDRLSGAAHDPKHPASVQGVAAAIAQVHDHNAGFGGDPDRICVMGHSAGKHLVALVSTDHRRLEAEGEALSVIKGVVCLERTAYDVQRYVHGLGAGPRMQRLSENAFGSSEAAWIDASPRRYVEPGKGTPPMVLFHTGRRVNAERLTEQQGPHLPVDFESQFVERVCVAVAEKVAGAYDVRSLVMPTLPLGLRPAQRGIGSGSVDIPQAVSEVVVGAVLDSLAAQGFRRILVWRGRGGHHVGALADGFGALHRGRARWSLAGLWYHGIGCCIGDAPVPGGLADGFATSIALCLRLHVVRLERSEGPESLPVHREDPNLDFARSSTTGVIGDATVASAAVAGTSPGARDSFPPHRC